MASTSEASKIQLVMPIQAYLICVDRKGGGASQKSDRRCDGHRLLLQMTYEDLSSLGLFNGRGEVIAPPDILCKLGVVCIYLRAPNEWVV